MVSVRLGELLDADRPLQNLRPKLCYPIELEKFVTILILLREEIPDLIVCLQHVEKLENSDFPESVSPFDLDHWVLLASVDWDRV